MRSFSNITALLLCLSLLFVMASCAGSSESDTPLGMKNATASGAEFRLYVPTVWNLNTAYGISGAYYTMSQQSTVSAMKYEITEQMRDEYAESITNSADETAVTVAETETEQEGSESETESPESAANRLWLYWYWSTKLLPTVEEQAEGGSLKIVEDDVKSLVLDGVNAWQYHTTAQITGSKLHFYHTVAEYKDAFYVITFTVSDDLCSYLVGDMDKIVENFCFSDTPYTPDEYVKILDEDAEAPEGMKLASNDDVAYRFYVPNAWEVSLEEEIFAAYVKEDRSNISVVPYMPNVDSMRVGEFFELLQQQLKCYGENFEILGPEKKVDLGGREATVYTYSLTVNGVDYQYMQVIAAYKSMIYSVTYTALPEYYHAHLSDVWAIIKAFEFR